MPLSGFLDLTVAVATTNGFSFFRSPAASSSRIPLYEKRRNPYNQIKGCHH